MRNRIWIVNTYSMGSQNLSICLNKLPFSITLIIETCCVTGIKYYTNSFDYKNELFALLLYNNEFCVTKFSWCNNHSICLIVSIKGQSHEKLSFCIEWKSLVAKIFPFLFFFFSSSVLSIRFDMSWGAVAKVHLSKLDSETILPYHGMYNSENQ